MKKVIFFLVLISSNCFSQSINIAPIASINTCRLVNKDVSDNVVRKKLYPWSNLDSSTQSYVNALGFNLGISATKYFNEKVGVEINLLYSSFNQKYKGIIRDYVNTLKIFSYTSTTKLNMIEVPVLFKYSGRKLFFEAGFQYSHLLNATYSYYAPGYFHRSPYFEGLNTDKRDVISDFNKSNISALLGIGYNLHIKSNFFLLIGIRGEYSLSDMKGIDAFGYNVNEYKTYHSTHLISGSLFVSYKFEKK